MCLSLVALTLLSLSIGQTGNLSIANDRLTYGHLGPQRDGAKYLPGDIIDLAFDVQNVTFNSNGKASYGIGWEVLDGKGATLHKENPQDSSAQNYLGGNVLPCFAKLQIPLESPPGTYTYRITVIDNATKKSASVERKIDVLPAAFGLIRVGTSADRAASIPWSPIGVVGDSMFLNFSAIGFTRDKTTKQPHLKVTMRVLDDKGLPTNAAPMTGEAKSEIAEGIQSLPMQFGITLNRSGRFTLELTALDALTGQSAKVLFPIRVMAP